MVQKNPYSGYADDKIKCELVLGKHFREDNFPVTIVRPSHTYDDRRIPFGVQGEGGDFPVLKRIMDGKPVIIHGDGTSLWTVTHSDDFAVAFTGLIGNPNAIGESVHITSNEVLTWNQIYKIVADAVGKPLTAVHVSSEFLLAAGGFDVSSSLIGDKMNSVAFDTTKIKRLVPEFVTKVPFSKGVRRSIERMLSDPALQKEDPVFDDWCDRVIAAQKKAVEEVLGK